MASRTSNKSIVGRKKWSFERLREGKIGGVVNGEVESKA
jgi:hypothetical protein